jgi:hypothetical protein
MLSFEEQMLAAEDLNIGRLEVWRDGRLEE